VDTQRAEQTDGQSLALSSGFVDNRRMMTTPNSISQRNATMCRLAGAVPAMKPEAAAIGDPQDGR